MTTPTPAGLDFVPLISDYGFKATFGNETDTLFLRVALQALINSPIPIQEVQFTKNTFEGLTIDSRSGVYDLACTDEAGNHFIVEMQLAHAPHFIQRLKFYALHKLNTFVDQGKFDYATLPKIYCVALLQKRILATHTYHTVANLRTASGELVDDQMTFVTVELAKFDKAAAEITTNLDKLLYTMKNLHTTEPTQYPEFWNEEWLSRAIEELNTRRMTPEERYQFARITAINAEVVYAELRVKEEGRQEGQAAAKRETARLALQKGLAAALVAEITNVPLVEVLEIQRQLAA